jgi:hypothetical protein
MVIRRLTVNSGSIPESKRVGIECDARAGASGARVSPERPGSYRLRFRRRFDELRPPLRLPALPALVILAARCLLIPLRRRPSYCRRFFTFPRLGIWFLLTAS